MNIKTKNKIVKVIKTILKKNKQIYFFCLKLQKKKYCYYLQKRGEKTLLLLDKLFKEMNINYWLDTSTLLGAIREKKFIKGDNDLGIGVNIEDYTEEIPKYFSKYNIVLIREYLVEDGKYGREQTYMHNGVEIDIFYHIVNLKEKTSKCHAFIDDKENLGKKYLAKEYTFPFEGLANIQFLSSQYKAPINYTAYLIAIFGESYLIPNPKWTMADEKNTIVLKNKKVERIDYVNIL